MPARLMILSESFGRFVESVLAWFKTRASLYADLSCSIRRGKDFGTTRSKCYLPVGASSRKLVEYKMKRTGLQMLFFVSDVTVQFGETTEQAIDSRCCLLIHQTCCRFSKISQICL